MTDEPRHGAPTCYPFLPKAEKRKYHHGEVVACECGWLYVARYRNIGFEHGYWTWERVTGK